MNIDPDKLAAMADQTWRIQQLEVQVADLLNRVKVLEQMHTRLGPPTFGTYGDNITWLPNKPHGPT